MKRRIFIFLLICGLSSYGLALPLLSISKQLKQEINTKNIFIDTQLDGIVLSRVKDKQQEQVLLAIFDNTAGISVIPYKVASGCILYILPGDMKYSSAPKEIVIYNEKFHFVKVQNAIFTFERKKLDEIIDELKKSNSVKNKLLEFLSASIGSLSLDEQTLNSVCKSNVL